MRRMDRIAIGVLGFLFFTVGSIGSIGSWGAYLLDSQIAKDGKRAEARVIDKFHSYSADEGNEYVVKYEFNLANGNQVVGQHRIAKQEWTELKKGDALQVLYAADNPRRNFPVGYVTSLGFTIFLSILCFLFVVVGGVMTIEAVGIANWVRRFKSRSARKSRR